MDVMNIVFLAYRTFPQIIAQRRAGKTNVLVHSGRGSVTPCCL